MNTKQTNLLFISLLFLARISTVVGAEQEELARVANKGVQKEDLARVINKGVQEEGLEFMAAPAAMTGTTKHFSIMLKAASSESKNILLRRYSLLDNLPMVKSLVEANADISSKNEDSLSALMLAAIASSEVVKYFLGKEAYVDVRGKFGRTPLMEVTINGNEAMVRCLLDWRADLDATDVNGKTALSLSRIFGHHEVERILLEAEQN